MNYFIYQIDFSFNKHLEFQIICAIGANLMYICVGMMYATSGFLITRLQDPNKGFGISEDEGSWVGKEKTYFHHYINKVICLSTSCL